MRSGYLAAFSLSVALLGCTGGEPLDGDGLRGKADGADDFDPFGSCVDACGEQSESGCWCDADCVRYDDCCFEYEEVCLADDGGGDVDPELGAIDEQALRDHVEYLAADELRGRATPSVGLDDAASYIARQFGAVGLDTVSNPGYLWQIPCTPHGDYAANVVGALPGSDPDLADEIVIVSGHYDHLGELEADSSGDQIANGANDNASSIAAMIEIARALRTASPRPARTTLFVAFCGEELGLFGSREFVASPPVALSSVVANINLEMLGRPGQASRTIWMTGFEYSDLGERIRTAAAERGIQLVSAREVGPDEGAAFQRSDNFSFAERDIVAHTIAAGRIDDFYHTVADEVETLDFYAMADLVRGIAEGVYAVANAPDQPRWSAAWDGCAGGNC